MRAALTLEASDIAQVGLRRYLLTLNERAQNVMPAWDSVLNIIYEAEQRLFAAEGKTEEHSKWIGLSDRYDTWKKKHYPGMPILTLTGRFRGSMTDPSGRHTEFRQPHRLVWGSKHDVDGYDLGAIHAEGRKEPPAMPAREPIRITRQNVDDFANVILDHILDIHLDRPRQAWEIGY